MESFLNDVETTLVSVERLGPKRKAFVTSSLKQVLIHVRSRRNVEEDIGLTQRFFDDDELGTFEICYKKKRLLPCCKMRDAFGSLACVKKSGICHES